MNAPLICHFLVAPPGAGKSTLARQIVEHDDNYVIVSTDEIRIELLGDENAKGEWDRIEAVVIQKIKQAIESGKPVIYDATNVKRVWRMQLLMKLDLPANILWMAWHLNTSLELCKAWNKKRKRIVGEDVIDTFFNYLKDFPPLPAEGFAAVNTFTTAINKWDVEILFEKTKLLYKTQTNRKNRTKKSQSNLHQYSRLIDFERLMHLIALIIKYPGIGNLHQTNPLILKEIFTEVPKFNHSVEEIYACIQKLNGWIYADMQAITQDLAWLDLNGITTNENLDCELDLYPIEYEDITTHPYSGISSFSRLIKTIRLIIRNPFLYDPQQGGSLKTLVAELLNRNIIDSDSLHTIRSDIDKCLKPYKILPEFTLRRGYFVGTAILSENELSKVFNILQSQVGSLNNPVSVQVYENFKERMLLSKLAVEDSYPVRAIGNRSIVDAHNLPFGALLNKLEFLEDAIINGKLLELQRFTGAPKFDLEREDNDLFCAYPLQIVFHNIAWYLGYEHYQSGETGLFEYQRLDRLSSRRDCGQTRGRKLQEKSLKKLDKLYHASAGMLLGKSASDQQKFLSTNRLEREQVEVVIELWCNDYSFKFIREETRRFPTEKIAMSKSLSDESKRGESIFILDKTKDPDFPNRFQVCLPRWSLKDIDLKRWILGFGGNIKVIKPEELVKDIKSIGEGIYRVYE